MELQATKTITAILDKFYDKTNSRYTVIVEYRQGAVRGAKTLHYSDEEAALGDVWIGKGLAN